LTSLSSRDTRDFADRSHPQVPALKIAPRRWRSARTLVG
jgi:hypothetical protein